MPGASARLSKDYEKLMELYVSALADIYVYILIPQSLREWRPVGAALPSIIGPNARGYFADQPSDPSPKTKLPTLDIATYRQKCVMFATLADESRGA